MSKMTTKILLAFAAAFAAPAFTQAANVAVGSGSTTVITTSTTWTANNVYNLVGQIYIAPGATLTIEAGTLIKSTKADGGSLAICRGAKIIANGTPSKPIIFTSVNDDLVTAKNMVNEWGNITIMGNGLISASYLNNDGTTKRSYDENPTYPVGSSTHTENTGTPTGLNKAAMEGLVAQSLGDPKVLYGGNNDNDDSGSLSYVSIRYGGLVITAGNELNGLSLGGVGRETDIHHIDIWDNVDDGIEIWGGTVNLKYLSIWNVGDDSFDVDQGWRGKAQFGLIVQGYSANAAQGSGVGDNAFEFDGAERSDAQPLTTATIYNFTVIGQPYDPANPARNYGDQGIALRDGARVQFRNCIFMDLGESLVKGDESSDAPATDGWLYGLNGTLTFNATWTTAFSEAWNTGNAATGGHVNAGGLSTSALQALYPVQTSGKLMELSDSVFYHNIFPTAYTNNAAKNIGYDAVTALPNNGNVNNVKEPALSPIVSLSRGAPVLLTGSLTMLPVTALDPRAANSAITSVGSAPADGFLTPAPYRGAFSKDVNWAKGWTAASAYGVYTANDSASAPPISASTVVTIVTFDSVGGVVYTVESSSDGKNWSPVATVIGDGTTKSISSLTTVDPSKAYRAIAQ